MNLNKQILNITSGDMIGKTIADSSLPGELLVWHDILYDGPRNPGLPTAATLQARAAFLEEHTGGGLPQADILAGLQSDYRALNNGDRDRPVVLWFDACLFDQSMLCHLLTVLHELSYTNVELLCVDAFPGIEPYNGVGQLTGEQLASVYDQRERVTDEQYACARRVDAAFAAQDRVLFLSVACELNSALPWVPAAVQRWLLECPAEGRGLLEKLTLGAIGQGACSPQQIFKAVVAADTPPQYWGDSTLWGVINKLADDGMLSIHGPTKHLPQWPGPIKLDQFEIKLT